MWNKPTAEELAKIPKFYSTEEVSLKEKMIHMHFFIGGCDWYSTEYSPEEQCFFGFAILNNDYDNAEWGYFSLKEFPYTSDSQIVQILKRINPCKVPIAPVELIRIATDGAHRESGDIGIDLIFPHATYAGQLVHTTRTGTRGAEILGPENRFFSIFPYNSNLIGARL